MKVKGRLRKYYRPKECKETQQLNAACGCKLDFFNYTSHQDNCKKLNEI